MKHQEYIQHTNDRLLEYVKLEVRIQKYIHTIEKMNFATITLKTILSDLRTLNKEHRTEINAVNRARLDRRIKEYHKKLDKNKEWLNYIKSNLYDNHGKRGGETKTGSIFGFLTRRSKTGNIQTG